MLHVIKANLFSVAVSSFIFPGYFTMILSLNYILSDYHSHLQDAEICENINLKKNKEIKKHLNSNHLFGTNIQIIF